MRPRIHKILVTGGAGFIGSVFVRSAIKRGYKVVVCDKLTYAGDLKRLSEVDGKYKFYKVNICNYEKIESIFKKERPETIVNFAAETHVDRSILDSKAFTETNIIGTHILLDLSRKYEIKKFIHISTDEVYGEKKEGKFTEDSPLKPNSPYAASKAAADLLTRSYIRTYDFPAIIIRPCNNYGPWQYPEKLIPLVILRALKNKDIPVYAQGLNVREWLYVADCAESIFMILKRGNLGDVYNIGTGQEKKNIEVVKKILNILGRPQKLIKFVKDRPGHDYRYSLDSFKIRELGWMPNIDFERGIREVINWHRQNLYWLTSKFRYLTNYWQKGYKN